MDDKIIILDSTLRDGSHAIKHKLQPDKVSAYCKIADEVGLYCTIIGHGNGLGASSLQIGLLEYPEIELLKSAKSYLEKTKTGAFILPGFGTIKDNIKPAINIGVDLFCVGCHCTEADVTKQHIEYIKTENKEVFGVLMMYHMTTIDKLIEETRKMKSYGADGIIIMDSAGASTPTMVKNTISELVLKVDTKIGFHAHNNLGLAVSNSYLAMGEGATIIDGTIKGFGAGSGNCQLEALISILIKENKIKDIDLYKLLDLSDFVEKNLMQKPQEVTSTGIVSGLSGVFSGFALHVKKASKMYKIDEREIFFELGRRKILAGQEDAIIDVALCLKEEKRNTSYNYQIESLT